MKNFEKNLLKLPLGSFYCTYHFSKYLVLKQSIVNNKIIKIYAKELKGNDIVSGNYFLTKRGGLLKPCEMSDEKVIDFVTNLELI